MQAPGTIEHHEAPGGDVYAVSQKKTKKKKEKEESAALYSKPDRQGQKTKSEGVSVTNERVSVGYYTSKNYLWSSACSTNITDYIKVENVGMTLTKLCSEISTGG